MKENNLKKQYDLIYFVGDSFITAINQADDADKIITVKNRFSGLISQFYNLEEVNRGMPGAGNHQIAKQLFQDMFAYKRRKLNPLIIVAYSDPSRLEVYNNKKEKSESLNKDHTFFKDFMVESFNDKFNQECTNFYIDCARSIINVLNFDYVECNSISPVFLHKSYFSNQTFIMKSLVQIIGKEGCFQNTDFLGHPNIKGHRLIADTIIAKINELYGTN